MLNKRKGEFVARKVAPILQCFRRMCKARKILNETKSALVKNTVQQEIEDLTREINILQERVGMTDGSSKVNV